MGGIKCELDLGRLLRRRIRVQGTVLRTRESDEKAALAKAVEAWLLPRLEGKSPAVTATIDRVLPLSEIAEAHLRMESNAHVGKIVLDHTR